jgi:hypothetical protein
MALKQEFASTSMNNPEPQIYLSGFIEIAVSWPGYWYGSDKLLTMVSTVFPHSQQYGVSFDTISVRNRCYRYTQLGRSGRKTCPFKTDVAVDNGNGVES